MTEPPDLWIDGVRANDVKNRSVASRKFTKSKGVRYYAIGILTTLIMLFVFVVPFIFMILTAVKSKAEASLLKFSLPAEGWYFLSNLKDVVSARRFILVRAFINSTLITVSSVVIMIVFGAMVGYVLQRRKSRWNPFINVLVLSGLIVPPAVVPTVWVLQGLWLFKTKTGMILIEVTFGLAFCVLLFRAFMSTIPREIDEAAIIDGANSLQLFFLIIFPLLKPVVFTVAIVQAVFVFNDFMNPLYFLPGDANATVQLTLYNFMSQTRNEWNLLFMDVLLITIPPLVMFIIFNRQLVAGMTSGAIKG